MTYAADKFLLITPVTVKHTVILSVNFFYDTSTTLLRKLYEEILFIVICLS